MSSFLKKAGIAVVILFALIGALFSAVFVGMQFGWFNVRGSIIERNKSFLATSTPATSTTISVVPAQPCEDTSENECAWTQAPEWPVIAAGLTKDASIINRVSAETGVPARIIASVVVPEQMRFFTAEREVFKRVFEPLKILGSMSQFSLGVSGIKQETAVSVEQYALDPNSPFFLGTSTAALIQYPPGVDHDAILFDRLTDEHNHYYSYVYTALYIRQVEMQWKTAGYDISSRPDVLATLFNIGFRNSHPNANPSAGGSAITVGGRTYAYGELAGEVYASSELTDVFPK
jgi:hypothetical protein